MLNIHNIYEACTLCENPFPYKCEECQSCIIEEIETAKLIYIGSGEDVCLATHEEYYYD
jgi:predicted amidophosphoribosyltransferase